MQIVRLLIVLQWLRPRKPRTLAIRVARQPNPAELSCCQLVPRKAHVYRNGGLLNA